MSNLQFNKDNVIEDQAEENNNKGNHFDEEDFGAILVDIIQDNEGMLA